MKRLFYLAAGMFALGCDDYVFAGLLPSISASLHISTAVAAQACSVYGITFVMSAPICIFLLARRPTRQVLIWALLVFIAGNMLTLLSTHWLIYLVSRGIAGLGAGLFLPIAVASATQEVAPLARGRALGLIWGSNCAGAVVGVPFGLWLAERISWRAPIILILALSAIALLGAAIRTQTLRVETLPSLKEQYRFLNNRRVFGIIGVTLLTATSSLGLYAFIAPILSKTVISSDAALSLWSIGGLIGSIAIGYSIDRIGKPKLLMTIILVLLLLMLIAIPTFHASPVLGLLPFFIWGALSWATVTPQQYNLLELGSNQHATLVALNSSAVSLGSVAGTALGGMALAGGFEIQSLPYFAAGLMFFALLWQTFQTLQKRSEALAANVHARSLI